MGGIKRGWALTRQSWKVLSGDLSLAVFPLLSAISAILAVVAIWAPTLFARGVCAGRAVDEQDPVIYIAGFATAYVSTFIAVFFNVALAACAVRSLCGEDTTVGEGFRAAARRIGPILGWAFVATTVGLILRALEERLPLLGRIAVWLTGAAWAVATFFVIPVVALEGSGPVRSLQRSAAVVKARWGESATGAATITVAMWLVGIMVVLSGAAGTFALLAIGQQVPGAVVLAVTVAGVIVTALISSALGQIFRVAVYQYAVSGQAPSVFDGRLLQTAFAPR
jgi:hypothetical protein